MSKVKKKDWSLYRQEFPEISFARFLVPIFATRDLQNDMFCQVAERARDFRVGLDPHIVGRRKEYLT